MLRYNRGSAAVPPPDWLHQADLNKTRAPVAILTRGSGGISRRRHAHSRRERHRAGRSLFEALESRQMLSANVLTWHNDNTRQGLNANETVLTPSNIGNATFGKLFSYPVQGQVYAQPLYV